MNPAPPVTNAFMEEESDMMFIFSSIRLCTMNQIFYKE